MPRWMALSYTQRVSSGQASRPWWKIIVGAGPTAWGDR